jgi:hypothetical protein
VIWDVQWYLGCSAEGLQILAAKYLGREVFFRATVPILRVQYDPTAKGLVREFRDDLNEQDSSWIDIYEGVATNAPIRYFAIDTYYDRGIGNYRILQRWVFWENGMIRPAVFSAGEQSPLNHRHHLYWRLDFDVITAEDNLVLEWQGYGNNGYGDGWLPISVESAHTKQVFGTEKTSLAIINKTTRSGYQIILGDNDGVSDNFARFDLMVQLYHRSEDLRGTLGTAQNDQVANFTDGENVDGQDVVVWYVAHLFHNISDKGREWHEAGPWLIPIQLDAQLPLGSPTVKIIAPAADSGYQKDQVINFEAVAQYVNGVSIPNGSIIWTDSIDGS